MCSLRWSAECATTKARLLRNFSHQVQCTFVQFEYFQGASAIGSHTHRHEFGRAGNPLGIEYWKCYSLFYMHKSIRQIELRCRWSHFIACDDGGCWRQLHNLNLLWVGSVGFPSMANGLRVVWNCCVWSHRLNNTLLIIALAITTDATIKSSDIYAQCSNVQLDVVSTINIIRPHSTQTIIEWQMKTSTHNLTLCP